MKNETVSPLLKIQDTWINILTGGELGAKATPEDALMWFHIVRRMYEELFRKYHTLARDRRSTQRVDQGHIEFMLEEFEKIRHLVRNPAHMIIAIILHDVVCAPGSKTNESDSAAFAKTMLLHIGTPRRAINVIMRLIMATRHHGRRLRTNDERYIADLDLAGFGYSWDMTLKNAFRVREEYAHVPDDMFRKGNAEIILKFIRRGADLYYTDYFRQSLGEKALENLRYILRDSEIIARHRARI